MTVVPVTVVWSVEGVQAQPVSATLQVTRVTVIPPADGKGTEAELLVNDVRQPTVPMAGTSLRT